MQNDLAARINPFVPYAGGLPLALGVCLILSPGLLPVAPVIVERAVLGYGALLLSFSSGVRRGVQLGDRPDKDLISRLLTAVGPLLGLVALILPFGFGLALLIVGFAGQGAWDAWSGQRKTLPEHYAGARAGTTLTLCILLMLILLSYAAANG